MKVATFEYVLVQPFTILVFFSVRLLLYVSKIFQDFPHGGRDCVRTQ